MAYRIVGIRPADEQPSSSIRKDRIYKAECAACGWSTISPRMLRILLDVDGTCPSCDDGGVYFYDHG